MKTANKPWAGLASILLSASLLAGVGSSHAAENISIPPDLAVGELPLIFDGGVDSKNLPAKVEEIWAKSKVLRAEALAKRIPTDPKKIYGPDDWLADLKANKWVPEVNALLRGWVPEQVKGPHSDIDASTIWYCYFGPGGKYPDRLEPETVALLQERMWTWANSFLNPEVYIFKRVEQEQEGKPYEMLPLAWGKVWSSNENVDMRYKLPLYLVLDALRKDPAYAKRKLGDKTVEEWFPIFRAHMIDYLRDRVMAGLWVEPGSGYAHLTHENLVRLVNVAPDPEIRQVAKMVLDLVYIEEELLSVNGQRGGGRSRSGMPVPNKHAGINSLMFGEAMGDLRFSIEFELSDYQVPATAIVLHLSKGAIKPYVIYNRLPGERRTDPGQPFYTMDSRLVNYVYRTPGYSLGCGLLDPNVDYHPSSNQLRASTFLFQSGQWIMPLAKGIPTTQNSGRSGKAFWSIQNENVMMLQQFADSENVAEMQVLFSGTTNFVEREGWIFAAADSGYAAVRFINPSAGAAVAAYQWDTEHKAHWSIKDEQRLAKPTGKFLPILIHAGDPAKDGTYEQFQKTVLEGKITIDPAKSRIEYQPKGGAVITWFYNQDAKPIELALVNGQPPNLQPTLVYNSPYMKAKFGDTTVYVGAGPFRSVYDFRKLTVTESKSSK